MLTLKAPAKVNWFLVVSGKREDGYHDIQSLIQCIDIFDTLGFEESGRLELITDAPIPAWENLVLKAAELLKKTTQTRKGARITLHKKIPLSAGLGGGSSDAAATLTGLGRLWGIKLAHKELLALSATLGSDIPFFLDSPAAVVEGRGEKVAPVSLKRRWPLLLIKPDFGVSTARAYGLLKEYSGKVHDTEGLIRALDSGDFSSIKAIIKNSLEAPVFREHPEVKKIKDTLIESGALMSLMSGSGPTVFGVFRGRDEAERASTAFPGHWTSVVETIT
jgi:4-diphosphocytidyl-2-C-methyl-D-erythritol kinase